MVSVTFPTDRATALGSPDFRGEAIRLAAFQANFNFAQFDTTPAGEDGHGVVTADELAVFVIYATNDRGGKCVPVNTLVSGVRVNQNVATYGPNSNLDLKVHELTHLLGAVDIYGPWHNDPPPGYGHTPGYSATLSLMSTSGGNIIAPDPWHRIQLGWVQPEILDINHLSSSADTHLLDDRPLILYDSSRDAGDSEYFILERRPLETVYDGLVTGTPMPVPGVAVWYVQTEPDDTALAVLEPSVTDRDGLINGVEEGDRANFALGHLGIHVGDPAVIASRGARDPSHNKLWPDGGYRLRWLSGEDVGVTITIDDVLEDEWRLQVQRNVSPSLGARLSDPEIPGAFDRFGATVATGDFNGDGFADLAVGASGDGPTYLAGSVHIYHGTDNGLVFNTTLRQHSPTEIPGSLGSFGEALAAGDFNGDGFTDLAVGAPYEALSGYDSGAVFVYDGSVEGLDYVSSTPQILAPPGDDYTVVGAGFGMALGIGNLSNQVNPVTGLAIDDLVVGAPHMEREFTTVNEYGSVYLFTGGDALRFKNGVDGVYTDGRFGTAIAVGNFNGIGLDEVAVDAPEATPSVMRVGQVYVLEIASDGRLTRSHAGDVSGNVHNGRYGSTLATGDFNGDGIADLAVGAPETPDGGQVTVYVGKNMTLPLMYYNRLAQGGLDFNEAGDLFGAGLAAGDFTGDGLTDLAIGAIGEAPWQDLDDHQPLHPPSGAVFSYKSTPSGLSVGGSQPQRARHSPTPSGGGGRPPSTGWMSMPPTSIAATTQMMERGLPRIPSGPSSVRIMMMTRLPSYSFPDLAAVSILGILRKNTTFFLFFRLTKRVRRQL